MDRSSLETNVDRSVKSATRAFDLLEVFERQRKPLRVADLVEALDAPQSSVSMLLKTLVSDGYVDFSPETREYCPSVRVAHMCNWVSRLPNRPDSIDDALQKLSRQTGETVVLGRIECTHVQYVAVAHSRQAVSFLPASGTKRPPHLTATGIVLMSTMDDERIGLLLRRYNAEVGVGGKPANIKDTLREVAIARELGHYQSAGLATPGHGVIAMLLPSPIRGQRLAMGVGAPQVRLQLHKREYLERLEEAISEC
jgi:IclR family transcriptional regulator, acetate operon repressor